MLSGSEASCPFSQLQHEILRLRPQNESYDALFVRDRRLCHAQSVANYYFELSF